MGDVVFAADPAYDPVGKAASNDVVQASRTQYRHMNSFELGEPHRSDARSGLTGCAR